MGAQRPSLMVMREPDACKWVGKPTGESPMSPERLAQRGEVWWVAFEPSVRRRGLQEPRSCDRQQRCCKSGVDQTQWILPGAGAYRFRHFSLRAVSAAGGGGRDGTVRGARGNKL